MKDFTGVWGGSVFNSLLMKRLFLAAIVVPLTTLSFLPSRAGDFDRVFGFYRPELFGNFDYSDLVRDLPMRGFLDGRVPGTSALGRMGTAPVANFPIAFLSAEPRERHSAARQHVVDPKDGKDYSSSESFAAEKASLVWTGGEVGFYYGHGSGKWSGNQFGSYITGGVGNEHLQINVGAAYEESHFSRSR